MADLEQLISKYMSPDILIQRGNKVDFLIDGEEYFAAVGQEIGALLAKTAGQNAAGGAFFYMASWRMGLVQGPGRTKVKGMMASTWDQASLASTQGPFVLKIQGPAGPPADAQLIDVLAKMVTQGVEVRTFSWASPILFKMEKVAEAAAGIWDFNVHSLLSTRELRARPEMQANDAYKKLIINTLNHPMGSMHLKMFLVGDKDHLRAYVSGLDVVIDRMANWRHVKDAQWTINENRWHDGGVKLEGPGAASVYHFYRYLYNGQLIRKHFPVRFKLDDQEIVSHYPDSPEIPARDPGPALPGGAVAVQALWTLPKMRFSAAGGPATHVDAPTKIPVPVLGPALPVLQQDIPIISPILDWLAQCIGRLLIGFRNVHTFDPDGYFGFAAALEKAIGEAESYIYMEDQSFTSFEIMHWINRRLRANPNVRAIFVHGYDPADGKSGFMWEAINKYLLDGIANPADRVSFFECTPDIIVHTKLTIIDDRWAAIGSANAMRRSLFMDGECSIGLVDAEPISAAQRLRVKLWGEHCGLPPDQRANKPALVDFTQGIGLFRPTFTLGKAQPTVGSPQVLGVDTNWNTSMVGLAMEFGDQPSAYVVTAVDMVEQKLTLERNYAGPAGVFAYEIFSTQWPGPPGNLRLRTKPRLTCMPLPFTNPTRPGPGGASIRKGEKMLTFVGAPPQEPLKGRFIRFEGEDSTVQQTYKIVKVEGNSATLFSAYQGPSRTNAPYKLSTPFYSNGTWPDGGTVEIENGSDRVRIADMVFRAGKVDGGNGRLSLTAGSDTVVLTGGKWQPGALATLLPADEPPETRYLVEDNDETTATLVDPYPGATRADVKYAYEPILPVVGSFLFVDGDQRAARWMYRIKANSDHVLQLYEPYEGASGALRKFRILNDIFLLETFGCYEPVERKQNDGDSRLEY